MGIGAEYFRAACEHGPDSVGNEVFVLQNAFRGLICRTVGNGAVVRLCGGRNGM